MMMQFRIERNQYGNMYIYCRDVPQGRFELLERCVCLRQRDVNTGMYR